MIAIISADHNTAIRSVLWCIDAQSVVAGRRWNMAAKEDVCLSDRHPPSELVYVACVHCSLVVRWRNDECLQSVPTIQSSSMLYLYIYIIANVHVCSYFGFPEGCVQLWGVSAHRGCQSLKHGCRGRLVSPQQESVKTRSMDVLCAIESASEWSLLVWKWPKQLLYYCYYYYYYCCILLNYCYYYCSMYDMYVEKQAFHVDTRSERWYLLTHKAEAAETWQQRLCADDKWRSIEWCQREGLCFPVRRSLSTLIIVLSVHLCRWSGKRV